MVSQIMETLDRFHGQVTGVFSGDEVLAGKNPSQGTELCAVVEYLFSLEVLLAILGKPELADRWERIAFNALPATFSPDMWAHQYDQQVNQVICAQASDPIYTTNGAEANLFFKDLSFASALLFSFQKTPHGLLLSWFRRHISALSHNEVCEKVPSRRLVIRAFDTWPESCRLLV